MAPANIKIMKISYSILTHNETDSLSELIQFLVKHKDEEDDIVIVPAVLEHCVRNLGSEKSRITIAVNININATKRINKEI